MNSVIRDARMRHGAGVRELARRCGVSAATVVDWERSEAASTIQSATLARALSGMGESLIISSRPSTPGSTPLMRREQRLGLELHRKIATKLIDDPTQVLAAAKERIAALRPTVRGGAATWMDAWERVIDSSDLGRLVDIMLGTTQVDIDMRSASPFTGLLSHDERADVLRRATAV